jgi:hypothetical protein
MLRQVAGGGGFGEFRGRDPEYATLVQYLPEVCLRRAVEAAYNRIDRQANQPTTHGNSEQGAVKTAAFG